MCVPVLLRRFCWVILLLVGLAGCSQTQFRETAGSQSWRISASQPSYLKSVSDTHRRGPFSGFTLLPGSKEALRTRLMMIELAEHSLDIQTYLWNNDDTGQLLAQRLLEAAQRGVRVRILIDELGTFGQEQKLAILHQHPNVQIRMYNPAPARQSSTLVRWVSLAGDFGRINNRMHNKLFIADNHLSILGGRNLGDEYFGVGNQSNFLDLDVLAMGPVTESVSMGFDQYWNSHWAVAYEELEQLQVSPLDGDLLRADSRGVSHDFPYPLNQVRRNHRQLLDEQVQSMVWARATLLLDPPRKDLEPERPFLYQQLDQLTSHMSRDVLISAPYLILDDDDIDWIASQVNAGARYRILTNSLYANDVLIAQYAYANQRKDLLRAGVELYELKSGPRRLTLASHKSRRTQRHSLHAKLAIYEQRAVAIGSFNADPRSRHLNTEVGLLIHSPDLARAATRFIEKAMQGENSYRVSLEQQGIYWHDAKGSYWREPGINPMHRVGQTLVRWMPVEKQL